MNYCKKCGNKITEGEKKCRKCDHKIGHTSSNERDNVTVESQEVMNTNTLATSTDKSNKTLIKVLLCIIIVLGVLGGVFNKQILGTYHGYKATKENIYKEKLHLIMSALDYYPSKWNKKNAIEILSEAESEDVNRAEYVISKNNHIFTDEEKKIIYSSLIVEKFKLYCDENNFEGAISEFEKMSALNVDYKNNEYYKTIMYMKTKELLKAHNIIYTAETFRDIAYYSDLDDDKLDEIVILKELDDIYGSDTYLEVYKYNDGSYKLADTFIAESSCVGSILGMCKYSNNKKGLILKCISDIAFTGYIYILEFNGNKIELIKEYSHQEVDFGDMDNDGIYELLLYESWISEYSNEGYFTEQWLKLDDYGNVFDSVRSMSGNYKDYEEIKNGTKENFDFYSEAYCPEENKDELILPQGRLFYLTDKDVKDMNKDDLILAKYEIAARQGYLFMDEDVQKYFDSKSWYKPDGSYFNESNFIDEIYKSIDVDNYRLIDRWIQQK